MNKGITLDKLAGELERQRAAKRDLIVKTGALMAIPAPATGAGVALVVRNGSTALQDEQFGITPVAHDQIGDYLHIPDAYYDRMLTEAPDLLATNINRWLGEKAERRMVRTLDGSARAFLSDRYRPMDNFDLMRAVMPVLDRNKVQVISANITETHLYVKAILPGLSEPLPEGVTWQDSHRAIGSNRESRVVAAVTISNSEVGLGSLSATPSVFETWCTNLAIIREAAMRKYHVGRAWEGNGNGNGKEGVYDVFQDDTRQADDKALWLKVRDVVEAAFTEGEFRKAVDRIKGASEQPIESDDLPAVVEVIGQQFDFPETLDKTILTNLIKRADLSRWGVVSAITATANTQRDYTMSTDLETAGGDVLTDDAVWKVISKAGIKQERKRRITRETVRP